MKRIAFFFDGTWNKLDAAYPTNVVKLAESVTPTGNGAPQITYYDEGVGTQAGEKWRGGLFGHGLLQNLEDAYRFLIFNYELGDEIYIFGFSRGAFTARSFAGMLRVCGIMQKGHVRQVKKAVHLYQDRKDGEGHMADRFATFRFDHAQHLYVSEQDRMWRSLHFPNANPDAAKPLTIRYLGVFDTVGAMGVPKNLSLSSLTNRKYQFFDTHLSDMVFTARHAVAIDERRRSFEPTLWDNLPELNRERGYSFDAPSAPYQQKWFPGNHGSVGGGGPIEGLSNGALAWVMFGAIEMGLQFNSARLSGGALRVDHRAPLDNQGQKKGFSLSAAASQILPTAPREGPLDAQDVYLLTRLRVNEAAHNLPEGEDYRPEPLNAILPALLLP